MSDRPDAAWAHGLRVPFVDRLKHMIDALHYRQADSRAREREQALWAAAAATSSPAKSDALARADARARAFAYETRAMHFYESLVCFERQPSTPKIETLNPGNVHLPFSWGARTALSPELATPAGTAELIKSLREQMRAPGGPTRNSFQRASEQALATIQSSSHRER